MNAGIIGLGIMGSAIARNLINAGEAVAGFDIDATRLEDFAGAGGTPCGSAVEVARKSDILLTSLPSAGALEDTVSGTAGLMSDPQPGQILAELSTLSIETKQKARDTLAGAGVTMLDCPLSGTGAQAATGDLAVYASGGQEACRRAATLFDNFSRVTYYLGEFGNGSKMKFVANLLVIINNVATAEAITLAIKSGLDTENLCEVLGSGAANSRILELRGPGMIERRFEPPTMKIDTWLKDISLIDDFATGLGVETPLFTAGTPVYEKAVEMGLGEADTTAICCVLEKMAGLDRDL